MKKIESKIINITPNDDYNYFFGYYEKQPWNKEGTKVLANRTKLLKTFPTSNDFLEVGYIDLNSNEFHKVGESNSWNWQQGCQLQWYFDHKTGNEHIIFNTLEETDLISRVVNLKGELISQNKFSIYTISIENSILTLNYGRLYDCRKDYGYSVIEDMHRYVNSPKNDGIYLCNSNTGEKELIINIERVASYKSDENYSDHKHWLNHMFFNPSGSRFCFLHRYERRDGIVQSRLFTSDLKGDDIRLIFTGMISHYDWKDDNTILAWAGKRSLISEKKSLKSSFISPFKKILKPIYYALGKPRFLMQKLMGDSFFLISDIEDDNNSFKIAEGILTTDGHCTFSHDRNWILTDGYTDKRNCLPLYLFNSNTNENFLIGKFWTPKDLDNEYRVDLHPRFNSNSTEILIDSAMNSKREMFIIKLKK